MSKEAMKLALEALEKLMRFESDSWELGSCRVAGQAIKALREALAEKPAQRTWVGLTEQEAAECWSTSTVRTWQAIEAKLKEKNT